MYIYIYIICVYIYIDRYVFNTHAHISYQYSIAPIFIILMRKTDAEPRDAMGSSGLLCRLMLSDHVPLGPAPEVVHCGVQSAHFGAGLGWRPLMVIDG